MRKFYTLFAFVTILAALLAACKPQTTPAPLVPQPSSAPVSVSNPNLPSPIAEDAAWAKVVAAARKEGKVNAYSYSWLGDTGLAISRAFKEKYGISVEITTGRGAEFAERFKTEKRMGQQVADITEGGTVAINAMKPEGVLTSVADDLPVLKEKGVWLVDPTAMDTQDKANLTWRLLVYNPYINTKLVKTEEVPQSWRDLLLPRWKGKMSFGEPNVGATVYSVMVVLMDNKVWDEDYIRALYRQELHFVVSPADELLKLARGENDIIVVVADSEASRFALEGAPIRAIDMKDGVVLSTAAVAAIAKGPNPNAARVFLNWIFSREGQTLAGERMGSKMVRKDVPDIRPQAVQTSMNNPFVLSVDNMGKASQLFRDKWFNKLVGR